MKRAALIAALTVGLMVPTTAGATVPGAITKASPGKQATALKRIGRLLRGELKSPKPFRPGQRRGSLRATAPCTIYAGTPDRVSCSFTFRDRRGRKWEGSGFAQRDGRVSAYGLRRVYF